MMDHCCEFFPQSECASCLEPLANPAVTPVIFLKEREDGKEVLLRQAAGTPIEPHV